MKRLVQAIWKMLKAIWYLSFGVEMTILGMLTHKARYHDRTR